MRRIFKNVFFIVACLLVSPILLLYMLSTVFFSKTKVFPGFSQMLSLFPGISGDYLRKAFYCYALKRCNTDVTIGFGTFFPNNNVDIGKFVYIGANCIIADSVISDDVMIGSHVNVISGKSTHNFNRIDIPMRLQGGESVPIHIGVDSWIGNGAIIMGNIGKKCIIGAGSVVTKDIEDYSVAVGNPAKIIKKRI